MRRLSLSTILGSFFLFSLFWAPAAAAIEGPFDHSAWDRFLEAHVNEQGEVNYEAIHQDPSLLNDYLEVLRNISFRDVIEEWPREEKLALWLNAYHAGLIHLIMQHYPVKSIQDIPGFWDIKAVDVGVKSFSLNKIRQDILISEFHDEKIHLVLSCASRTCPKMRREAFKAPLVEGQLYVGAREFVNDEALNQIIPGEKAIYLSQVFKWYAHDFVLDFGNADKLQDLSHDEAAVLSFVAYYTNDSDKIDFLESRNYKIKYQLPDWQLNEWSIVSR